MVGILLSYWGGLFSGATLVSGRVFFWMIYFSLWQGSNFDEDDHTSCITARSSCNVIAICNTMIIFFFWDYSWSWQWSEVFTQMKLPMLDFLHISSFSASINKTDTSPPKPPKLAYWLPGFQPPKWMVYFMENPIKHGMIWGAKSPYFWKHPYQCIHLILKLTCQTRQTWNDNIQWCAKHQTI